MEGVGDDALEFLLCVFSLFIGAVIAYFVFRPSRYVRLDPRSQQAVQEARRSSSTNTSAASDENNTEGIDTDSTAPGATTTAATIGAQTEDGEVERDICAVCRDAPTNPIRTPCNHWYCGK